MEDIMTCEICGYEMEWLDTCEHCDMVYCEYCGTQGDGCCRECEESGCKGE